jgi:Tfp pilus assembly protein PilN
MMIERIAINLLPAEYRIHKKTLHLHREIVYPLLVVGMVWSGLMIWNFKLDNSINEVKRDITVIEQSIRSNKPIKDEIERLRQSKIVVQGKIQALEQISVDKAKWVRLMEVLCQRLPNYTWINSCDEKDSSLIIEGSTFSFPEVANFMSRLSESPYIKTVDLSGIEERGPSKTFWFSISCRLNSKATIKNSVPLSSVMAESKNSEGH